MRPIIALLVAIMILGGVKWFLDSTANRVNEASTVIERVVEDKFTVDVMLTFEAGPDPFGGSDATSLVVSLRGKNLIERRDSVPSGRTISVDVDEVVEGKNEFYVSATASDDSNIIERALRVRVLRNGQKIAEQWVSSSPGEPVTDTVMLTIEPSSPSDDHQHEH